MKEDDTARCLCRLPVVVAFTEVCSGRGSLQDFLKRGVHLPCVERTAGVGFNPGTTEMPFSGIVTVWVNPAFLLGGEQHEVDLRVECRQMCIEFVLVGGGNNIQSGYSAQGITRSESERDSGECHLVTHQQNFHNFLLYFKPHGEAGLQ
jgi:hypothetical protein